MAQNTKLDTKIDSVSNALGVSIGKNLMAADIDSINVDAFMDGLKKAMGHQVTQPELAAAQQLIDSYVQELRDKKSENLIKVGSTFLANNAKKPGVVELPSGLQYKVIKAGTGPKPADGDNVTTHYTGTFIDGKVFDSSVERGTPATFNVNGVIKGWTEALKLMPEGSKWELYIPYDLAYGAAGRPSIPPYSVLVFEIELIDVVGK
ncbi:MAG: FKBP-type peptidyl-prolyl cis-trans isomerase [Bacteroidetes bacterium]|nr:FKBP-type peptidyl-prolyl cis-trans isomerase [Bacteroidota bacterium]